MFLAGFATLPTSSVHQPTARPVHFHHIFAAWFAVIPSHGGDFNPSTYEVFCCFLTKEQEPSNMDTGNFRKFMEISRC